jgi:hypothetical protein
LNTHEKNILTPEKRITKTVVSAHILKAEEIFGQ